ncbi:MAG: Type pantothenate kinase [Pseudomonadota bacterium]
MTFLAIDVGNTRLKWALYDRPHTQANVLAQGAEFLENIETLADGPWVTLAAPQYMLGCVVAGDAVKRRVQEQMELWDVSPQWVVSSNAEAGISNGYDHPTRLGSDRWVAMVGARHRMLAQGLEKPLVVVMVGTAVTVEALDQHGKFLGGFILPGHGRVQPDCTCQRAMSGPFPPTPAMPSPVAAPMPLRGPVSAWCITSGRTQALSHIAS